MKNAYIKDNLRTIKKNAKRFLAIMAITALGLTAFAGIIAACNDMYISADKFYDEQRLFDIRVLSTLGVTDEDTDVLQNLKEVEIAESGYSKKVYTMVNDLRQSAEMVMLSSKGINIPYLVEGFLPQKQGEIAVTQKYLNKSGKAIGDTLIIDEDIEKKSDEENSQDDGRENKKETSDTDSGTDIDWDTEVEVEEEEEKPAFLNTEYTITGVIIDPMRVSNDEGTAAVRSTSDTDYTFFITPSDVDTDVYTAIYLVLHDTAELDCYGEKYVDKVQAVVNFIEEEIVKQRQQIRYETVKAEALEKITDAEKTMKEKFTEADQKFTDAWEDIKEAKQELSDGEEELKREEQNALLQFEDARAEIKDGKIKLEESKTQLEDALKQLNKGKADYESGLDAYNDGLTQYEENFNNTDMLNQGVQQGIPGSMTAMQLFTEKYSGNEENPEVSKEDAEAFMKAAGTVTNVLEGMKTVFVKANETDAVLLFDGILKATENTMADNNYLATYNTLLALDLPSNPSDPASPTPNQIMEGTITTTYTELEKARIELSEARDELLKGKAELDDGYAQYNDGMAQLKDAQIELEEGENELNTEEEKALKEIKDAWKELNDGRQELIDGEIELIENEQEYKEKRKEAEQKIDDAYIELKDISMTRWYLQDRTAIDSYSGLDSDLTSIDAIGRVFPILFLIVAVLISLTTMTRMVEEERSLIGTYKALGFNNFKIGWKYILYALLASLTGSIVGNILGFFALPKLLIDILHVIYIIPNVTIHFDVLYAMFGAFLFMSSIVIATGISCHNELKQTPAALMRPKAPRAGSRILLERINIIWSHLKFLNKVTARNLFRYKKRLFMTIIGIAGCTALVLTGFAIRDSVTSLMPKQYDDIYRYDLMLITDEKDNDKLVQYLHEDVKKDAHIADFISVQIENVKAFNNNGYSESIQMTIIPKGQSIDSYINNVNMNNIKTEPDNNGILITKNAAEMLDLKPGDPIMFQNLKLDRSNTKVKDVVKNYLGNNIFITQELYETLFDEYKPNAVYANFNDEFFEQFDYTEKLLDEELITASVNTLELKNRFTTDFAILNYVIYILIALAAGLAFVVLFTLSNTNISERLRELATIKVLGFFDREMYAYVNKETLILTFIGVLTGMPLGYIFSDSILSSLEMPSLDFALTVELQSYLFAGVISFSFALIVNLITNRILKKINMVEALKSVE